MTVDIILESKDVPIDLLEYFEPIEDNSSVWKISTKPFSGAHFAVFPPYLVEPMLKAGCPEGGVVLDPFFGAGTVGLVALQQNKDFIGIELNKDYIEIANTRLNPLLKQTKL